MRNILFIAFFIFTALYSCEKPENYSPVPEVEFISIRFIDTIDEFENPSIKGTLIFSFFDGDGDLGDTLADSSNVFITYFYKENGEYFTLNRNPEDHPELAFSIPVLEPRGYGKSVKGEIEIRFDYYESSEELQYDTIKYDFYIKDRAGNSSNIESTGDVVL